MNFKTWLLEQHYITPDELNQNRRGTPITFIYTNDKKLHYVQNGVHTDLMSGLGERYYKIAQNTPGIKVHNVIEFDGRSYRLLNKVAVWKIANDNDLLGRVANTIVDGKQVNLVSFWSDKQELYRQLLDSCLAALQQKRLIDRQTDYISTPLLNTVPIANANKASAVTPDNEKLELQKRLHLMTGNEKKDAMKKLGVGWSPKSHPWQSALKNAGLISPGTNWRYPHSESLDLIQRPV